MKGPRKQKQFFVIRGKRRTNALVAKAHMKKRKTHPRVGGQFEDFLRDEGRLEEATGIAIKRVRWNVGNPGVGSQQADNGCLIPI